MIFLLFKNNLGKDVFCSWPIQFKVTLNKSVPDKQHKNYQKNILLQTCANVICTNIIKISVYMNENANIVTSSTVRKHTVLLKWLRILLQYK